MATNGLLDIVVDGGNATSTDATVQAVLQASAVTVDATITGLLLGGM